MLLVSSVWNNAPLNEVTIQQLQSSLSLRNNQ